MIDLMGKRYWYFAFSLLIIVPGMIMLAIWGLPLSIDFKGGTLLEAQFASGKTPPVSQVVEVYRSLGISDVQAYTSGADVVVIRSSELSDVQRSQALSALSQKFNDTVTARRADTVGPILASQVAARGLAAIGISSLILIAYITFVFRGVQHSVRFGIATVAALVHDLLVLLSLATIGGHFWGWQIDTLFLTAILTVIAFSAQDTIVILDRIRENTTAVRKLEFEKLVNHSVVQSLTRSLNTQIMAVDFLLLALALFGGLTLREFATILLVGMISGSYSSGFNAAPILVVWENQEWKTWFRRKPAAA